MFQFTTKRLFWLGGLIFHIVIEVSGQSVRFYGGGVDAPDADRIKIQIDDVSNSNPGPPVDVGAEDFTIEFWMKADAADNMAAVTNCGDNINWIYGNIVIDRDRYNQDRKYGVSIAGGYLIFGVSGDGTGDQTICSSTQILDNEWHHIAIQRRRFDGYLWMYIDGSLEAEVNGPEGDISYPDDEVPCSTCCPGSLPCNYSDPFIVLGAEKHDAGAAFPSYNGLMEELRFSDTLRYLANFKPLENPYSADNFTVALYHFDTLAGDTLFDASNALGGPSHGLIKLGGDPEGPVSAADSPFSCLELTNNSWTGNSVGDWNNGSGWSAGRVPQICDAAIINAPDQITVMNGDTALAGSLQIGLGVVFDVESGAIFNIGF